MTDTVENLILDLVEWVGKKERTYAVTMESWRTSCPRLPVWEDATDRGFVETRFADGRSLVGVTPAGLDFLREKRPQCYEQLRRQNQDSATESQTNNRRNERIRSSGLKLQSRRRWQHLP